MNTFTESCTPHEGGDRPVERYMVFASDALPQAESMGGFQYDHANLEYVLRQLRAECLTTKYTRFEVLDTQTFQIITLEVQPAPPPPTYRVVLREVPVECRGSVMDFLALSMKVKPAELRLYVQTCPSFVGQQMSQTEAQWMVDQLMALGCRATLEVE